MDIVLNTIEALQRTPLPTLLIILGSVLLFLAFVRRIEATIDMPPGRQAWAGLVGVLLLIAGIVVSLPVRPGPLSSKEPQRETRPGSHEPTPPSEATPPPGGPLSPDPSILASGTEVKRGSLSYTLVSVQVERVGPGTHSLWVRIRVTTQAKATMLHHNAFRLLVNGVPQAPEQEPWLSELVPNHSAKEGVMRFVLPDTVTDVHLQIMDEDADRHEWALIPMHLKAAKP
jgi:hypothetical protein